jgi:two-component system, NtrC family, sensor histidine kinase HydH
VSHLDDTLPTVQADPDQLRQAFGNLILNSFQAMQQGGRLVIKSEERGPGEVFVSFTDTGAGMDAETLRNAFEPLFTTKATGIGLGLALTKRLIERNGGTVEVKSNVSKGTAFSVSLPPRGKRQG